MVDAFYHQLCPECAAFNRAKRDARTDLTGRTALLTGGRAKIGMYIALRLLRDGAHTTITTRFPNDAVRRFAAMHDSADWLHRLRIVGIDLRDPAQVVALADTVAAQGPLDILINNAAQTVRRSPGSYAALVEAERTPPPELWWTSSRSTTSATPTRPRWPAASPSTRPRTRVDRTGADRPQRVPGADRRGHRHRRGRPAARHRLGQQLDPARARGRRDGTARGAAVQPDRAVHPGQPAAPGDGRVAGPPQVRRERVGDGGPVQPRATRGRATRTPTWPRPR